MRCARPLDMRADLGDNGGAECHIGDEMAVHLADVSVPMAWEDNIRALEYNVNVKP